MLAGLTPPGPVDFVADEQALLEPCLGAGFDSGESARAMGPPDPGPSDGAVCAVVRRRAARGCLSLASKSPDGMLSVDRAAHAVALLVKECESYTTSFGQMYPETGRVIAPVL